VTHHRPRQIVLGIGNPDRGDDAAGRAVAQHLRPLLPPDITVIEHGGEAAGLFAELDGTGAAFLVDASASGAPPGTIRRFDASEAPLPDLAADVSTHGFGLAMAIELARALGQLPARCIVYAIEGASFTAGAPLSPPVASAVVDVVRRLCAEISEQVDPEDCHA
jgi:hydrogenase maturation protease